jgi:Flp pilus assembly protein TadD
MAVSVARRRVRDRVIREAEGYLELLSVGAELWELDRGPRDRLAQRILQTLLGLEDRERHKPYALYLQGLAYRTMEQYDDAIVPLEEAAELDPDDIHVWLALGWCYKRSGQLAQAIEALNKALVVDPSQAIIHYNLACYWSLAGSADLAI